jgi:hypothetical protein
MRLEEESARQIAAARADAEAHLARELEKARAAAQAEADRPLAAAARGAESLATTRLEKEVWRKILESPLRRVQGQL